MRQFSSISDAVAWADRYLMRDGLGSHWEAIEKGNIQQCRNKFDIEDDKSTAQFISIELSLARSPQNRVYRAVYGESRQWLELAQILAQRLWAGPGCGKPAELKTIAELRALALLVMLDWRRRKNGGGKVTVTEMAKQLRMSRSGFYEKWIEDKRRIDALANQWLMQTEDELYAPLWKAEILR